MKNGSHSLLISLFTLIPFFFGCTNTATPLASTATNQLPVEIPTINQESTKTNTPAPTATPIPTETPPPLPCTISFDSNRDGNLEIYRMAPDGSDTINLTRDPGDDSNPTWSPDGSQIAFVSNRKNGNEGGQFIYIMNSDGSNVRQLSLENESKRPDWSHDGKQITFTHKGDIYIIKADGSGQSVNLTNSPEEDNQSIFSPDSSKIVWLSGNNGKWNVYVMNTDGSNSLKITDNSNINVAKWTIDGRILTEWGWKDQQEFCHNCVVNADGTNIIDAGGKGEVERYQPFWTMNGDMVGVANVNMFTGDNEIYLVGKIFPDPKGLGAGFVNLTNNPADDRNPDWPSMCSNGRSLVIPTPDTKDQNTAGQQKPSLSSPIVLGYAGNDGWNYMREHDFKKACDELGIQCVNGKIQELLKQGATAVIQDSGSVPANKLAEEIKPALDKNIPVFVLDTQIDIQGVYSVTIDRREWVKASLGWMMEKIGGKGQITYFDHEDTYDDAGTIKELVSQYPEIEVIEFQEGDFDPDWVKPQTQDILTRKPDVKAIWTDGKPDMVIQGLQISKLPVDRWPLINCDANMAGLEFWVDMEKKNPEFDCVAPVNPPGIAYDAAYAAYYLASGMQINSSALEGPYKNSLFVPMPLIDNDSLQKWAGTINKEAFFADELMKPEMIKEKWFSEK